MVVVAVPVAAAWIVCLPVLLTRKLLTGEPHDSFNEPIIED